MNNQFKRINLLLAIYDHHPDEQKLAKWLAKLEIKNYKRIMSRRRINAST